MSARSRLCGLSAATDGVVAVEFAFVLPVLLALFFGGYSVSQGVSIGRKVTITTRALADLTTQYATMSATDMATVLSASTEIIAPFSATPLQLRVSEISTDATGLIDTVTWSVGQNKTALVVGSRYTLPVSMQIPNVSYILSEVTYVYNPLTTFGISNFNVNDSIFMLPRISKTVTYTG